MPITPSGYCAYTGRPDKKQGAGEPRLAGACTPHGPYFGAGVWLRSRSPATQTKLAAMLALPLPLYFATLGKTQSGRVIRRDSNRTKRNVWRM